MSHVAIEEILRLPLAERLEVAEAIWDSIADSAEAQALLGPTDDQRAELRRRSQEHDRDPSSAVPWDEVRRKLGGK